MEEKGGGAKSGEGQLRSSRVRSGQVRSGQVKSGQVTSGHVRSGHFRSGTKQTRNLTYMQGGVYFPHDDNQHSSIASIAASMVLDQSSSIIARKEKPFSQGAQ
jgi:hypothetical protein